MGLAKQRFKIPTALDSSYLDMEFTLSAGRSGISKPVTGRVILFALVSSFLWFYLAFQSFISKGGFPAIAGFTVSWVLLSILLVRQDNTRRMGMSLVLTMLNYVPKSGRYVPVRMSDNVHPLKRLYNIDYIDVEDGLIHFMDGTVGHGYHVVGSASALMFEQDKQIILDAVDDFYRKLPVRVEPIFDTVYEGHSVDEQLENLAETQAALKSTSPGLHALLEEQGKILKYAINNNQGLKSLHQYLIVKAPSESLLSDFEHLLAGDVEGDGLMFRLAKTLTYDELTTYYHSLVN